MHLNYSQKSCHFNFLFHLKAKFLETIITFPFSLYLALQKKLSQTQPLRHSAYAKGTYAFNGLKSINVFAVQLVSRFLQIVLWFNLGVYERTIKRFICKALINYNKVSARRL